MATILPFKRNCAAKARRRPLPEDGAAIVIFPGVRYERRSREDDDSAPPAGQVRKRRRQR